MEHTVVSTDVGGNTSAPTIKHLQLIINNTIEASRLNELDNSIDTDPDKPETDIGDGRRSRAWFFTLNNPTEAEKLAIESIECVYRVWQMEIGESCHTIHCHGLIYYKNAKIWGKNILPRARWEKPRDLQKAIDYCKKEHTRVEGPWEWGIRPSQGRRVDLEEAARKYLDVGEQAFAEENPATFIRYYRGLRELRDIQKSHRDRNSLPRVEWRWGRAGVGKTREPIERHSDSYYIKDGTQWWNGYDQQEAIIIDDFDGKWPYRDFLRLLDRYPYQGQTKGSYVKINSPFIYITCEHPPDYYWGDNELVQVTRRISHIEHVVRPD